MEDKVNYQNLLRLIYCRLIDKMSMTAIAELMVDITYTLDWYMFKTTDRQQNIEEAKEQIKKAI